MDDGDNDDDNKSQQGKESEGEMLIGTTEASTSSEGVTIHNQSMTIEELITKKKWERDILTGFMWGGAVLWGFLGTICFTYMNVNDKSATGLLVVGIVCGTFAMSYFASPMTTMLEVIKQRDASSLYPPMVIANIVNCFCWVVYGLMALDDPIIYGQNGAGMALNVVNLVLVMVFPRTRANALVQQEAEKKKIKAGVVDSDSTSSEVVTQADGAAATANTPPAARGLEIA
jgi:solute carrier family 50 protein (sugar transporter)